LPINVKPLTQVVQKYVQRASAAGAAYTQGIQNPKQDWQTTTVASAQTWATGVQNAITDGRFVAGVNKAGDTKWSTNSINIGAPRYPGGITAGQTNYQNGIQPFLQLLSTINLPPRAPKGDPANLQRVSVVDAALRNLKLQLG